MILARALTSGALMLPVVLTGDVALFAIGAGQGALAVALGAIGVEVYLIPATGARDTPGIQVSPVLETLGTIIPTVTVFVYRAGFRLSGAVAIAAFTGPAAATSVL